MCRRLLLVLLLGSLGAVAWAPSTIAQNQPLTHDDYDRWEEIEAEAISDDGAWVWYVTSPPKGDGTLHVAHAEADRRHQLARGTTPQFTADAQFVAFLIEPPHDSTRQAKLDDVPPPKQPKDALGLLDLSSGDTTRVDRVQSYQLPEDDSRWIAYHHEPPRPDSGEAEENSEGDEDETEGAPLTIRHLESGETWRYEDVTDYTMADTGALLAYTQKDSTGSRVHAVQLDADAPQPTLLHESEHAHPQLALDDEGTQVAFLAGPDSADVPHHDNTLYRWLTGDAEVTLSRRLTRRRRLRCVSQTVSLPGYPTLRTETPMTTMMTDRASI